MTYHDKCTDEQYNSLHEAVSNSRASSKEIKVDKVALQALLDDHANLQSLKH